MICLSGDSNILMSVLSETILKYTERSCGNSLGEQCWHGQSRGPQERMTFQPMTDTGQKEKLRATVVGFHLIIGDIFLNNNSGTDSPYYQNTSSRKEYIICKNPSLHHWDMEYFLIAEMKLVILPLQTIAPFFTS